MQANCLLFSTLSLNNLDYQWCNPNSRHASLSMPDPTLNSSMIAHAWMHAIRVLLYCIQPRSTNCLWRTVDIVLTNTWLRKHQWIHPWLASKRLLANTNRWAPQMLTGTYWPMHPYLKLTRQRLYFWVATTVANHSEASAWRAKLQ